MSSRHDRLALLDRYLRIPTISREVTPAMVEDVRAFWRDLGLDLDAPARAGRRRHAGAVGRDSRTGGRADPAALRPLRRPAHRRSRALAVGGRGLPALRADVLPRRPAGRSAHARRPRSRRRHGGGARRRRQQGPAPVEHPGRARHRAGRPRALARARDPGRRGGARQPEPRRHRPRPPRPPGRRRADRLRRTQAEESRRRWSWACAAWSASSWSPTTAARPRCTRATTATSCRIRCCRWPGSSRTSSHACAPSATAHDAFRREATELFAKWEDKAVWKPFLRPTVNINHFMSDGASPTARRTIIPRTAHARLDIRVTPDTPPAAMIEIVERCVADHRDRTPGITFSVKTRRQPASYTSPARPEFGWLLRLLEQHGDAEAVALPTLGGTLPLWVFTETLGHPGALDPRRQQRQPAARRQRALRAASFLPADRTLRGHRRLSAGLTPPAGARERCHDPHSRDGGRRSRGGGRTLAPAGAAPRWRGSTWPSYPPRPSSP